MKDFRPKMEEPVIGTLLSPELSEESRTCALNQPERVSAEDKLINYHIILRSHSQNFAQTTSIEAA